MRSLVVLTGAGISAESGIQTFRGGGGLWENYPVEEVASPEGFLKNPTLVHSFYNERRRNLKDPNIKPNAAHLALAELESLWHGPFLLVTQNVDNLHERAGSKNLLHMHGQLNQALCTTCDVKHPWDGDMGNSTPCPSCNSISLRPDIVWFGEIPYDLDRIFIALESCDLFISIGTSGRVYPAAGFSQVASRAHKIEVNVEASEVTSNFDEHRMGHASIEVPKLVSALLRKR